MGINANYMTLNPLYLIHHSYPPSTSYVKDGNLTVENATSNFGIGMTHGFYSGKWYWEILLADKGQFLMGFVTMNTFNGQQSQPHNKTGSYLVYTATASNGNQGYKVEETSFITINNFNAGDGDIIGFALDRDNRKLWVSLNGTFINSGDPAGGNNPVFDSGDITATTGEFRPIIGTYGGANVKMTLNAGQDSSFIGQKTSGSANASDSSGFGNFFYTPPTGFLSACSKNMPISTDVDPAETDDDFPQKQFNAITYTGSGSTQNITGVGFQPDLVITRGRSEASVGKVVDSVRGATKVLQTHSTSSESTDSNGLTAFGSDGYTLGSDAGYNNNSTSYVAWCWRAGGSASSDSSGSITVNRSTNNASKFSIITYTGNGSSGSTIAHGLGVKPAMTWIKQINSSNGWNVWHQGNNNGDYDSFGELNSSASWYQNQGSNGTFTSNPTTSLLTLSSYGQVNGSGNTYVCYAWANVDGMQRFGSYLGNGNNDGQYIFLGFRPRYIITKSTTTSSGWTLRDSARNTHNPVNKAVQFNTNGVELTSNYDVDFLSQGFKIRINLSDSNSNGDTYIYGAWADQSGKYSNTF